MRNVSPSLSPRLPTLKGEFGLFLRIYQPKAAFGTGECASAPVFRCYCWSAAPSPDKIC
jgi:hypothetical protein